MKKNEFYVYGWKRKDYNTYFYIGKGKGNRCFKIDCRSKHFKNIINHTKCECIILYDNLYEEDAFKLEMEFIKYLVNEKKYTISIPGYKDKNKYNHLVNKTWGGEGSSGFTFKQSQRTIQKRVSKIKGKKRSLDQKNKISKSLKKVYEDPIKRDRLVNLRKGSKLSNETKLKLSQSHKGKKLSEDHKTKIKESLNNISQNRKNEMNKKRQEKTGTKVKCIELGVTFDSLRYIEKFFLENYNKPINRKIISQCCKKTYKNDWYGEIEINGILTKLHWEYITPTTTERKNANNISDATV